MLLINTFLIIVLAAAASGQTQVDLRTQAKAVNFTGAAATLPLKTGTTLPSSCQPAELFFKTNASAGSNIYGCTSNNTWTVESGAGSSTGQLANLVVTRTGPTVLTVGSGCVIGSPCNVRFGNTVYSIQNSATATVTVGSGLAFIYISSAGVLTVGHGFTVTCSTGCLAPARGRRLH